MRQKQTARIKAFARRNDTQARQLIDGNDLNRKTYVIYVDAAIGEQEQQPMFTTAWSSYDATTRGNKLHLTHEAVSSSLEELCAIVEFASTSVWLKTKRGNIAPITTVSTRTRRKPIMPATTLALLPSFSRNFVSTLATSVILDTTFM
ncbi:hypothetical protein HPB48_026635 [Haemaphysalis longicornis]|uniref:Uncharacterized protein n=1 Tax=Haemaphysalis longicornis TaxID=44386 RepID=A0A9J6HBZ8_HAELO|nr:hypothetical protein HPB48_026635 [Haemaphysalis longicornis]